MFWRFSRHQSTVSDIRGKGQTHHEGIAQSRVAHIMTHRSDDNSQYILRPQNFPRPSRSQTMYRSCILVWPAPRRTRLSQKLPWGQYTNVHQEGVSGLEDVDSVHIIVIGIGGVVYSSDGE